ncbi:aspartyl/asparaginyl beta-hydroxylase domain-containing protein [Mucilaginibacter sp. L196]|uniref:aspartyl/asparaginyl beta-hydroxylase domain-containing protein n=1 Tax=Mucilaginibacter sp. L196 TaxID=1641870 RepID=UPI00131E1779|nr:aspartyl/asparaginyl beta-hydroxylase domain-containing protein [Mucilaginibacter sp. L196]
MICFAKLPLKVSITDMQHEVSSITESWYPHLNTFDYQGNWEVLSLRSPGGASSTIIPDIINGSVFMDTPLMATCPSIKKITENLLCPIMAVRLLNLKSGAKIKPHKDNELAFEKGEARIHIPVFTNDGVEFYVEDNLVRMNEGECWYINANLKHSVVNNGKRDRIHLVIDCVVNDGLIELFEKADKTSRNEDYNVAEKILIIEALRLQQTPVATNLATELEYELNAFLKKSITASNKI